VEREAFELPLVKVCGLSTPGDVACAVDAGCDAIGLVAHPASPRAVDAERAASLCALLTAEVTAVAVFVDRSVDDVTTFLRESGAHAAQLCGDERPEEWRDCAFPILRRVGVAAGAERELEAWSGIAAGFVLDHESGAGGTGRTVDWTLAGELARRAPCLLAGGLDASNVVRAVDAVRPRGVDASSRLETLPGRKDPLRVRAFVLAARSAFEELER
jgi:phosphoribosylanthranilate isomerase